MEYQIRKIKASDNAAIEQIIRDCLIEFKANHAGTAWEDASLKCLSEAYHGEKSGYWVAIDGYGTLVGGVGIAPITDNICELQKLYCVKAVRGCGVAKDLLKIALTYAKEYYDVCYLETLTNMDAARHFYEKHGFKQIKEPVFNTNHFACDIHYLKELK